MPLEQHTIFLSKANQRYIWHQKIEFRSRNGSIWEIYETHEPIPTTEELFHKLKGSDRFYNLDVANCYHQFVIEENARKIFSFWTPWGIFCFKPMVTGTSLASSKIQKKLGGSSVSD